MAVRTRLSVMMFLQYFSWGTWYVTMVTYLSSAVESDGARVFSDSFVGLAYGAAAIAAMIAPFFVGLIADRYFSTEKLLCVLHLAGAAILFGLSRAENPSLFYPMLLAYFLAYMPTMALTNSISFHHLEDPARQFPGVRVLGTIGWIVAGLLVGSLLVSGSKIGLRFEHPFGLQFTLQMGEQLDKAASIEPTTYPMLLGAATEFLLGLFCLALPHTPPTQREGEQSISDILGLDALALLKDWSFLMFVLGSFLVCIPLQFYYAFTNGFLNESSVANAAAKQTYGQMSEIFFMLLMPLFFSRLGVKWMLLVGMCAWAVRYVLFAYGNADERMWMLYLGILLHGICYDFFFVTGQIYVDNKAPARIRASAQGFLTFVTLGLGLFVGSIVSGRVVDHFGTPSAAIKHDWQQIWLVPAAMAGVVMVLFALLFHDHGDGTQETARRHES
ncbi:MAG: nucleoside permease [Pirellulales bacterium]|nr:nucleoside permease [Pirellulales bacterium]